MAGLASSNAVRAGQSCPSHPVTVILPFCTRRINRRYWAPYAAQMLPRDLKQTFLVENRTGAGGVIGISTTSKAQP